MPYPPEHKQETRRRIIESARRLFNRRGFSEVSIDEIMAAAGLTRGGFYHHFKNKEELYIGTLAAYASGREDDAVSAPRCGPDVAQMIFNRYVSRPHLDNIDEHCPLMALPSDVARAGPAVRAAYRRILEAMITVFAANLEPGDGGSARDQGMAMAAMCVGAMVLARTIDDGNLADDICAAARASAGKAIGFAG